MRVDLGRPEVEDPLPEADRLAMLRELPEVTVIEAGAPTPRGDYAL
jgi:hypothetical protein